jgi:hypothetical protein
MSDKKQESEDWILEIDDRKYRVNLVVFDGNKTVRYNIESIKSLEVLPIDAAFILMSIACSICEAEKVDVDNFIKNCRNFRLVDQPQPKSRAREGLH